MCLFSFDKEKYEKTIKNEGITEGEKKGEKKGRVSAFYDMIKKNLITLDQAATAMELTTKQLLDNFKKYNLAL